MYGLSVGVANIGDSLPRPAYALLSGLNASTVGIIALAAVQLSEKTITDTLTRVLVFLGAAAGILHNALWYFPLLMALAGIAAVVYDLRWLHGPMKKTKRWLLKLVGRERPVGEEEEEDIDLPAQTRTSQQTPPPHGQSEELHPSPVRPEPEPRIVPQDRMLDFSWKLGTAIIVVFFLSFTAVMVLRGLIAENNLLFSFFANMYLAGTIIFGGGPVVIPLLSEYVVAEGWVSARDFLIGLAIQQSFPGPNFNFAVYLGALTAANAGHSSALGALLGFLGIFAPGLITVHGTMGIWSAVRGLRWVKSLLRGINAAAVGLIYTAVYRLWQVGFVDEGYEQGTSLALEPWMVVITATSYVGGYWFGVNPPTAIIGGGIMGLVWYGVVSA